MPNSQPVPPCGRVFPVSRRLALRLVPWACLGVVSSLGFGSSVVLAAESASSSELGRLQAEVSRLAQEQREQRALIFQLMQADQQRYDLLLKFLQSGGVANLGAPPALPSMAAPSGTPSPATAARAPQPAPLAPAAEAGRDLSAVHAAKVTGRVHFDGAPAEAYVYLDGLKTPSKGAPQSIEIRQKDKQFQPRVSVVPLGARVSFPNEDTVVHNVFSASPEQPFDLGNVKMGEKPAPVVMTKPGALEVFCNIHSRMTADILVVPNAHWAKVAADGSFEIPDVPLGHRKLVLWGPGMRSVAESVDVTPRGGTVTFSSAKSQGKPHLNKTGQAYGSYDR